MMHSEPHKSFLAGHLDATICETRQHSKAPIGVAPTLPQDQKMPSRNLTDRFIQSCKPAPAGKRLDFADAVVPGLALRVTDRGHKTFVLRCRYPLNPENPTRRALGDYGALTLDEARQKARHWLELICKGIDPKLAQAPLRAQAQPPPGTTCGAV